MNENYKRNFILIFCRVVREYRIGNSAAFLMNITKLIKYRRLTGEDAKNDNDFAFCFQKGKFYSFIMLSFHMIILNLLLGTSSIHHFEALIIFTMLQFFVSNILFYCARFFFMSIHC